MNNKEMRDKINAITRWIAYTVYPTAGINHKFSKAYDRLSGKVFLDHDINIDELTQSSKNEVNSIFDVLGDNELVKVLASAQSLQKMYNDAMECDYA